MALSEERAGRDEAWREVRRRYRERHASHAAREAEAAERSRRLSNLRAATFLAIVGALVLFDFLDGGWARLALGLAAALVAAFALQVRRHRRVRWTERWEGASASLAHEGLLRAERRWKELGAALPAAERPLPAAPPDHPYAHDLDVTGAASLVRLLGPVTSERGRARLASWLLAPSPADDVARRRAAVRALAPEEDLRTRFTLWGRLHAPREALEGIETFLRWAEDEPWFLRSPALVWLARTLPLLLVATVLADVLAGTGPWWLVPALAQLVVYRRAAPAAADSFARAEVGAGPVRALVPQIRLLEDFETREPYLASIRERLGTGRDAAHRRLERAVRLLDTASSRRNMMYQALAPVLLLDVHLGLALDRWRSAHGAGARDWLDAAGEWEALSALATLAHDHPDWTFPGPADAPAGHDAPAAGVVLQARGLGHPLLAPERCVRNDVRVGPPGTFLLVTGSNMSGKSTLLRAVGVNAVLAAAGAPVCADAFSAPPLRVHTSMRIDDSLVEGISLFMAELLRIRDVVDAARAPDPEGRPVLYLLDEMLHGTNTAERRVAARGVLEHLLSAGAIGAVSTHDLTLAEVEGLRGAAVPVHFREEVAAGADGRPRISFDYRLRPGIATTRNALQLLAAVGLAEGAARTPREG